MFQPDKQKQTQKKESIFRFLKCKIFKLVTNTERANFFLNFFYSVQ